jgi:hypothetical protein
MQNEGAQEAVCEGHVRAVERLTLMRDSPMRNGCNASDQTVTPRLMLRSLRSSLPHCGYSRYSLIFEASLEGGLNVPA